MVDWKDCIVPIGGKPEPDPFPLPQKRIPVRCSTCGDWKCRIRFLVVEWKHCGNWFPAGGDAR